VSVPCVRDLLEHLESRLPASWAEPWDRVGLAVGDPTAALQRVFVTLDPTPDALACTLSAGANVLLTHHPVFLEVPETIGPGRGLRGMPFEAVEAGVALVAAHTNLDRAPEGADALATALGLKILEPLERSEQAVRLIVSYVSPDAAERVLAAAAHAGAGRVGQYAACSFASDGTGRFTALDGSSPAVGVLGESVIVTERRIEIVCAPELEDAVVAAVRQAHPYEEPVVLVSEAWMARGSARMGRICESPVGASLESLAETVSARLGVAVRVWGERTCAVRTVALAPGSGRSLVADALAAGCDAVVTGELRYHESLDAAASGLAVVEAGHDATEWPLTRALARIARETPGIADDAVVVDEPKTRWWTAEGA
jgi:dinuclear metal center YbgI/SA1388 family protein